jgi:hypothetical protein
VALPTFTPDEVIQFHQRFDDLTEAEKVGASDFPSIFNQGPGGQQMNLAIEVLHHEMCNITHDLQVSEGCISASVASGLLITPA